MKTRMLMAIVAAGLAVFLAGCASYTISQVRPDNLDKWGSDTHDRGYVFFQPELYFLVTTDLGTNAVKAGNPAPAAKVNPVQFTVRPIYLPNYKRPYRVTTCNFLAKSDFNFNFAEGWQLTSISDKSDNTAVANTIAGELKTILAAGGLSVSSYNPEAKLQNQVLLLHPDYDDKGQITNVRPVSLLEVER